RGAIQKPLAGLRKFVSNVLHQIPVAGDEASLARVVLGGRRCARQVHDLICRVHATDAEFGGAELFENEQLYVAGDGLVTGRLIARVVGGRSEVLPRVYDGVCWIVLEPIET